MKRNCDHCGNMYEFKKSSSRYCSTTCRANASKARKLAGLDEEPDNEDQGEKPIIAAPPPPPTASDPASQYIISHQAREIARWEDKYKEQEKESKRLADELKASEKKIADLEMQSKIKEVAQPQKSTLEGFMEHPFMLALAPHIGPSVGKVIERMSSIGETSPGAKMMSGAPEDTPIAKVLAPFYSAPADVQNALIELLSALGQAKAQMSEVELMQLIYTYIQNVPGYSQMRKAV